MKSIGVLGSGSFGTALAVHGTTVSGDVRLWARRGDLADALLEARENETYLPGVELPAMLQVTPDIADLAECDIIINAVPSHGFREALRALLDARSEGEPLAVVSASKGIEVETLARMSHVIRQEGERAGQEVRSAVLSGPSFAAELGRGTPTLLVVAAHDEDLATLLRERLASPALRLYSSSDVAGVEIGGATKNVIAIAAGVVAGLELGQNTLAALITRGLHEITRLVVASGGEERTAAGLTGLGDLVLTCTGGMSRNRQTGIELAAGKGREEITGGTHMVAEGIRTSLAIAKMAEEHDVSMPITEQVVALLYEGKDPRRALGELMTRELKPEKTL
ncbi:MAG: NAD(P)H-dependent glycerol-3-phosphate dehydrogenase [Acidobacteriota bacterium]